MLSLTNLSFYRIATIVGALLLPAQALASSFTPESVGIRARFSGATTLGKPQPEEFKAYDISADFRLPWRGDWETWYLGGSLMTSAGYLSASGQDSLVVSVTPKIRIASKHDGVYFDAGAGGAYLSRHQFERQDFGGAFQFSLTVGAGVTLYKGLGLGYRFMHYSDGGLHGSNNVGADFHMLEINYRF
ncbi:acyloxyacyl hydrolase [Paraferrimonas sedimenticola]|uniref:acyloxyacyl hydrolase n=1 Tax=Paraferrimonas sedimenticola TaxID=375674 RepID=UPI00147630EC|nr:acyloxyacyl hydrolase [Paraferrimonas sedimenticola]